MKTTPVTTQHINTRHVTFSNTVEIRHFNPTETIQIEPSMHAKRLERNLKSALVVKSKPPREPIKFSLVKTCKNVLYSAAMVCGALFIPSFALIALGPIGLIGPAALAVACIVLFTLAGDPTPEMQEALDSNRRMAQEGDSTI